MGATDDLPPNEQTKVALGRWSLLSAPVASPKEATAVLTQVLIHLPDDARAVRATISALSGELLRMRARVRVLEARLGDIEASEDPTPAPGPPPVARRPIPLDVIEEAEREVAAFGQAPAVDDLRREWAEVSKVFHAFEERLAVLDKEEL